MGEDNTWYVAIQRFFGNTHYSFIGAGSESYRNFRPIAVKHQIEIVAERFGVSDLVVNRLTGFDGTDREVTSPENSPLALLVQRLNQGEQLNSQEALDELCSV
jgi:hypothetical protein